MEHPKTAGRSAGFLKREHFSLSKILEEFLHDIRNGGWT